MRSKICLVLLTLLFFIGCGVGTRPTIIGETKTRLHSGELSPIGPPAKQPGFFSSRTQPVGGEMPQTSVLIRL